MGYANLKFTVEIDGDRELSRKLNGLIDLVADWSPFFEAVVADWWLTSEQRFMAQGAFEGDRAWEPLSERYARWKAKRYPGARILERTGELRRGTSEPKVRTTPMLLEMTIDVPYAIYHQSSRPRKKGADGQDILPRRPFASLTRRQKTRWMGLLRRHIWGEVA